MPKSKIKNVGLIDSWGRLNNRKIEDKICENCGISFRPKNRVNRTCSKICGLKIRKSGNVKIYEPTWFQRENGYITGMIYRDNKRVEISQHKFFMETYLGRRLLSNERVIHKNNVKNDNRIDNLLLVKIAENKGKLASASNPIQYTTICDLSENWATIKNYPKYMVSDKGRVKYVSNKGWERLKKQHESSIGYKLVGLSKEKKYLVHRLVSEAFIPNPNNYPCVNHKDYDKMNNKVENLEWCTHKQNSIHAYSNPIIKASSMSPKKIEGSKKVTRERAMGINVYKDGVFVKYFETAGDCASYFGWKAYSNIYAVMNGKYKQYKGYTFEKVNKAKEALKAIS